MRWIDNFKQAYLRSSKNLIEAGERSAGSSDEVGGSFDAIGYLEKQLLLHHGLMPNHFLVDIGCGSGRLLSQLGDDDIASYLGTDISAELLGNCEQFLTNADWALQQVEDCDIPLNNDSVDMVCMFSVITHLLHQQSFRYFKEAARVLKPGGKLIVSFLEFRHPGLWPIFEGSVDEVSSGGRLDTFVDRDGLRLWAEHSGLEILELIDGEQPHIPIDREVEFDNGLKISSLARLGPIGQSIVVCVRK